MGLLLLCVFCAGHADQGVKHVDLSGKIYLSYLHECSYPHSDLVVLFRSVHYLRHQNFFTIMSNIFTFGAVSYCNGAGTELLLRGYSASLIQIARIQDLLQSRLIRI
jgi:hypothetical protein